MTGARRAWAADDFSRGFSRIFNRTLFFDTIDDGKPTALDIKCHDMTGPIDGKNPWLGRRSGELNTGQDRPPA